MNFQYIPGCIFSILYPVSCIISMCIRIIDLHIQFATPLLPLPSVAAGNQGFEMIRCLFDELGAWLLSVPGLKHRGRIPADYSSPVSVFSTTT